MFRPSFALGKCLSLIIVSLSSTLLSVNTWAVSAGCTAVNAGAFDRNVAGITLFVNDTFEAGEVLRFTYSVNIPPSTVGATMTITDINTFIEITIGGAPASPFDFTIPANGNRQFSYAIAAGGGGPTGAVSVTCPSGETAGGANENSQNSSIAVARQQSDDILDIINRNINGFTGGEYTEVSNLNEVETVTNPVLALTIDNDAWDEKAKQIETENFAIVLDAAAQYSANQVNKALRTINLDEFFIFTEVQGVLTFDSRGPNERSGNTISASTGLGYKYSDKITIGIAGSFSDADSPLAAATGETNTDGVLINPFISYRNDSGLLFTANGGVGFYDNDLNTGTTTAKYDSFIANIAGAVQADFTMGDFLINPRASFTYEYIKADGFTDSGGTVVTEESESTGALHFNMSALHKGFNISPEYRLLPFVEVEVEWSFQRADSYLLANGNRFTSDAVVGEVGGGFRLVNDKNFELLLEGGTRQLGQSNFDVYHFGAQLSYTY